MKFQTPDLYMDYAGQKLAEKIFKYITVAFGIIGFVVGYYTQQLSHSMVVLGIGCVIAGLITLPAWPMYRSDPIKWRKPKAIDEPAGPAAPTGHKGKSKKKH